MMRRVNVTCPLHEMVRLTRSERRCSKQLLHAAFDGRMPRWARALLASMVLSQPVAGGSYAAALLVADD